MRLSRLVARWRLRGCAVVGASPTVLGRVFVHGPGRVIVGDGVIFDASSAPIELRTHEASAEIVIGDGVRIDSGVSIEAVQSVQIGPRATLRRFSKVMDNHFHPLVGDRHQRPESGPVRIGAGAEIGARAVVLSASRMGEGARLRAGAVLTRKLPVPDGATAGGLPAVLD
jgi:acetyltransferase-like isoleucine patch superfamily enzyme